MSRYWNLYGLFIACVVAFSSTSFAGTLPASQILVKGDVAGYAQSKLPLPGPVVVYVYTASGNLAAMIRTHGDHDGSATRKVEAAIKARDFHEFKSPHLVTIAGALKDYFFDQGYRVEDLLSKKTPYTILLAVMDLSNPACANALKVRDQSVQALRRAMEQPSVLGAYTMGMLELSSSTVKIECKK